MSVLRCGRLGTVLGARPSRVVHLRPSSTGLGGLLTREEGPILARACKQPHLHLHPAPLWRSLAPMGGTPPLCSNMPAACALGLLESVGEGSTGLSEPRGLLTSPSHMMGGALLYPSLLSTPFLCPLRRAGPGASEDIPGHEGWSLSGLLLRPVAKRPTPRGPVSWLVTPGQGTQCFLASGAC